jgi:hypothetical protein
MTVQLRAQAQEIQRLNCQLINNAHIISRQAQVIKRLTENDGLLRTSRLEKTIADYKDYNRTASKSPSKLSLTQKKIMTKPRLSPSPIKDPKAEIDGKIQVLNRRLDDLDTLMHQTTQKNR